MLSYHSLLSPESTQLSVVLNMLHMLPKEHIEVLRYLLKLLHKVALGSDTNKMTVSNLGLFLQTFSLFFNISDNKERRLSITLLCFSAVCIGPNIIRDERISLQDSLKSASTIYAATSYLIQHAYQIFPVCGCSVLINTPRLTLTCMDE